jgi:hypothetical protein
MKKATARESRTVAFVFGGWFELDQPMAVESTTVFVMSSELPRASTA